ncbi:MAG: Gx transporter family protein [Oscillospiraceae bacterium]
MQSLRLKNQKKIKKITYIAMLFAITVVLMSIEAIIPPIPTLPPGIKLGLSNIVIMYCIFFLNAKYAFAILLMKSTFVFLTRGIIASILSLSGGLLSILAIIFILMFKKIEVSYTIISIFGSISHNMAQMLVSSVILKNQAVLFYSPILIISGIVMGIITGVLLKVLIPSFKRIDTKNNVQE